VRAICGECKALLSAVFIGQIEVGMELGLYQCQEQTGAFVLTPAILLPPIEAEHLFGPLAFMGFLDTNRTQADVDWVEPLRAIEDQGYAVLVDCTCALARTLTALVFPPLDWARPAA
jgi:hypothetical protein